MLYIFKNFISSYILKTIVILGGIFFVCCCLTVCSNNNEDEIKDCPSSPFENPVLPPPPGIYIGDGDTDAADRQTYSSADYVLGTYYYYWYDVYSGMHLFMSDGSDYLKDHPSTWPAMDDPPFSYLETAWHRKEMLDMLDAGMDFVLPVYWGRPGYYSEFSFVGLDTLVKTHDQMVNEGYSPPRIGMFYDTFSLLLDNSFGIPPKLVDECTMVGPDLTTYDGKLLFYGAIRDFFSLVPSRYRLRFNGKCAVWLYVSQFACDYDDTLTDFINERFREDFNEEGIFLVKEYSWRTLPADMMYSFGAAALGYYKWDVAAVGPGMDTSLVYNPRCSDPIVVDRQNGARYKTAWSHVREPGIVVIESWNEFHEATEICDSYEYGRMYIDITRQASTRWKSGR